MVICGKEYQDVEFTAETIIKLGMAACPFLEHVFNIRGELRIDELERFAIAYAALVMRTSPHKAGQRIRAAGEAGAVAEQLSIIINRSPLMASRAS